MVDTDRFATTFAMLDKDGDGLVSAAEFKELMTKIGVQFTDETAAQAIEMMDGDGDGLVSLEELAAYMGSPAAPQLSSSDEASAVPADRVEAPGGSAPPP
jgi:Ca2+-binding EF-hand superfamily protein